jgi:hypothetical protein
VDGVSNLVGDESGTDNCVGGRAQCLHNTGLVT